MAAAVAMTARALLWAVCLQWLPRATLAMLIRSAEQDGADDLSSKRQHPRFDINLDLPPRQRFKHLVPHYREWFISILAKRREFLKPFNKTQLKEFVAAHQLPEEYIEEIRGVVEEINHPEASVEMSLYSHMKYELGLTQNFECTGILAAMRNGTVVHGRNLDLGPSNDWAKPAAVRLTYWRNGTALFEAVSSFGMVGVGDVLLYNKWSAQQNTRRPKGRVSRSEWLRQGTEAARQGAKLYIFELRRHLEAGSSFEEVRDALATTKFNAPFYIILAGAGPYQGSVLSIDRYAGGVPAHDVWSLSPKQWFLVQTNDDHWEMPQDDRRDAGKRAMALTLQRRVSRKTVFKVMRSPPICHLMTWHTFIVVPAFNTLEINNETCWH